MKIKYLRKYLILLSFFVILKTVAYADTFVVTSNADSGPGTLREAITLAAANGSAVTDHINFNIADHSESGRTILIQSVMPSLNSNVIVDGTTQPGTNFSISNAKVMIYMDHVIGSLFTFMVIESAKNVKIFGMGFSAHNDLAQSANTAILLRWSSDIVVGEPGKGNLFSGVAKSVSNNHWSYYDDTVFNVTIQSNVFGLNRPGYNLGGHIYLERSRQIKIGGSLPAEGNIFTGASIFLIQSAYVNPDFFVWIENNWLDYDGTQYNNKEGNIELHGNGIDNNIATPKTIIKNNLIASNNFRVNDAILLVAITHQIIVQGNKIGTDITGKQCKGAENNIFVSGSTEHVYIGGYSAAEQNTIGGEIYTTDSHGVHIAKNSIVGFIHSFNRPPNAPFIIVTAYGNGLIKGESNNGSKIQLYSHGCIGDGCIFKNYFGTTYADPSGNWSFPYTPATPHLVATATIPDSATSEFSSPIVTYDNNIVTHTSCGKSNGSIKGIVVQQGTHIRWYNSAMQLVSTDTNLINVPAGTYTSVVTNGEDDCKYPRSFEINNWEFPNPTPLIIDASCGQANGKISVSSPGSFYGIRWLSSNSDSLGSATLIDHLLPGNYYLKMWALSDTSCNRLYGPIMIDNLSGPTLDVNSIHVTDASCGDKNGSIENIAASGITGNTFISWEDGNGHVVGNSFNVSKLGAGRYRLKFKDQSSCDTIVTPYYTVSSTGLIAIDSSDRLITGSQCGLSNGSITGLKITGAGAYKWINTNNQIVGTSPDLSGVPAGNYMLQANNNFGCKIETGNISVDTRPFIDPVALKTNESAGSCNQLNGSIEVTNFPGPERYTFRWVDSLNPTVTLSTSLTLEGFNSGSFFLYAKNAAGCEQRVLASKIAYRAPTYINETGVRITGEVCSNMQGSIDGMIAEKGTAPYTYQWIDENNKVVSSLLQLNGQSAGKYKLIVNDQLNCADTSNSYTIINSTTPLDDPIYSDQSIFTGTKAMFNVQNPQNGTYYLFDSPSSAGFLDRNTTGIFSTSILTQNKKYYIELVNGICKSKRIEIKVSVFEKTEIYVPSVFTPNGDGKNDEMKPIAYGPVKLEYFIVYNRYGKQVFLTNDILKGWNGTYLNKNQPVSAFTWILKAKEGISGKIISKTGSFLLVR